MSDKKSFDHEAWIQRNAERIGVEPEKIRRAFVKQIEKEHAVDDVFEVPDQWIAHYRYTHGGQSRFFRELMYNKKLYGTHCSKCDHTWCPPRTHCSFCYEPTEWVELSGKGEIVSFTTVHFGTSATRKYPFVCAYVRPEGTDSVLCVNMDMDDVSQARVGLPVKVVFKEVRDGRITDIYFRPVEE